MKQTENFELVDGKVESETLTRDRKSRKTNCSYSMTSIIAVLEFSFKLIVMIWAMPANMLRRFHSVTLDSQTKHTHSVMAIVILREFSSLSAFLQKKPQEDGRRLSTPGPRNQCIFMEKIDKCLFAQQVPPTSPTFSNSIRFVSF